jgi:hypothetical protein
MSAADVGYQSRDKSLSASGARLGMHLRVLAVTATGLVIVSLSWLSIAVIW